MFFWRKKSEITRCKRNTQNLSDNLYLTLCCAARSPLDPRFPGHIHALCVQHPLSAESSCVFCHHAVNSPHRGDLTPRPVPHLEHRDSFHPEEFSWRQQVKQHKAHKGLCRGAVVPAIRSLSFGPAAPAAWARPVFYGHCSSSDLQQGKGGFVDLCRGLT